MTSTKQKQLTSIDCSAQPFDLSFHPTRENLVAAGLVDGTLEVHDCSGPPASDEDDDEYDTILASISLHTQQLPSPLQDRETRQASCRAVRFSDDGSKIFTGGSAGDICVLDAERACTLSAATANNKQSILWKIPEAHHPHGVHLLHQLPHAAPTGNLLVSGDEEGGVRLWDVRQSSQKPVLHWKENTDYISGFDHNPDGATLLASSADCTLSVFDLRRATGPPTLKPTDPPVVRRSDDQEDELLSVKVMKHGKKVVCGTQEGVLAVWSFGTWGDISDRFPGHPASIDALLKVDEDTLLTGSSDGMLRLVQIHPDKLLGVLGDHDGYPIEKLHFNATRSVVGSVSHDSFIRLWDARMLHDDYDDEEESAAQEGSDDNDNNGVGVASIPVAMTKGATKGDNSDDQWSDDSESDDSDSASDDASEEETANARRAKRFKTDNEKFFEDL
jgi:WD40 repeat protein